MKRKNKRNGIHLIIKVRNKSDIIMIASALRRVGMEDWHVPYEGYDEISYGLWGYPIKCIRLYFMLCRTCKVRFGRIA